MTTGFANALAESVWEQRYRFAPASGAPEPSIDATWDRVARALSKLGVYTQEDLARLAERVDKLSDAVNALIKSRTGKAVPAARAAAKPRKARKVPRVARKAAAPRARKA